MLLSSTNSLLTFLLLLKIILQNQIDSLHELPLNFRVVNVDARIFFFYCFEERGIILHNSLRLS